MRKYSATLLLAVLLPLGAAEPAFTPLFNGKDLTGWKPSENPSTWTVRDGAIVAHGKTSHLFYEGGFNGHSFRNFELKVDVMTKPKANGGVYIETEFQDHGFPGKGFEIQVNNTYPSDPRKTFSIYEVQDVNRQLVPDNRWFTEDIIARDDSITVKYNGKVVATWMQPADWKGTQDFAGRRIRAGTIALQAHDPDSEVWYKNIRIKPFN